MDSANQIANLITKYIQYTPSDLGKKYNTTAVSIASNIVTLTLAPSDYTSIAEKINDAILPNPIFTLTNFHLKNRITSFLAYPNNNMYSIPFGFSVIFEKSHNFDKDQLVTLKDFSNPTYNTIYKVVTVNSKRSAILYPMSTIPIIDITVGLGFFPYQYTVGVNGVQSLTDLGLDQVSFIFDPNLTLNPTILSDLDLDFLPKIIDYQNSVLVINAPTFFRNEVNQVNSEYLIIDTTSSTILPVRSRMNSSEVYYPNYGKTGMFDTKYNINLLYVLERKNDDSNNQTFSGSDLSLKQEQMYQYLTSIFCEPLKSDETSELSNLMLIGSIPVEVVNEGRAIFTYVLEYSSCYNNSILIKKDLEELYPINSVKINTDEINFA